MFTSLLTHPNSVFGQIERLSRGLDEAFGISGLPSSIRSVAPGTSPLINIGTTDHTVEVYVFAPGLKAEKIEVTFDRGVLRVAGERKLDLPNGQNEPIKIYSNERIGGRFERAISLPEDIDPDNISASYRDGVLRITVARREPVQPKRISIQ